MEDSCVIDFIERTNLVDLFIGVFPADKLPQEIEKYPCCFIFNTDIALRDGSHWVAIYLKDNKSIEVFGSWGLSIYYFPLLYNYINYELDIRYCTMNLNAIQKSDSKICGLYCIYFLIKRCNGKSFEEIINKFTKNKCLNDIIVCNYVDKYNVDCIKQLLNSMDCKCKKD